jgi:crotonobetainyl-CoA:carnitine CoA-transferase CaiB-like acyl-CoA transferase
VGSDEQWQDMCREMGREELAADPRFSDLLARRRNHDELDGIISSWTTGLDKYDAMHRLQALGIPSGPVLTGKDVHFDPHYQSRGFFERVTYPEDRNIGTRPFISRPYKFSRTPLQIRGPAPVFGQDNEHVLQQLLGLGGPDYEQLVQDAIVGTVPTRGDAVRRLPQDQLVELGLLAAYDPDYRQRLGIG